MKPLIFIKLGGSLITDKSKPYTAKKDVIARITKQVKKLSDVLSDSDLILGNGTGSFGHYTAKEYGYSHGKGVQIGNKAFGFCEIQHSAARLNRIVVEALLTEKVAVCSISPSSIMTSSNRTVKTLAMESIEECFKQTIIPVVYGDIVLDDQLGSQIFSTEDVFNIMISTLLEKGYSIKKIIHATIVDGVFDTQGKVISEITQKNFEEVKKHLYKTEGFDVTGGMLHKIETALHFAKEGIVTHIMNGNAIEQLAEVVKDQKSVGTSVK